MSKTVRDTHADKLTCLPAVAGSIAIPDKAFSDNTLQLTQVLQTTLDLEHLLDLFSEQLNAVVKHDGFRYVNGDLGLDIKIGQQARHSCTYNLPLGDERLGKIALRRAEVFSEDELATVEYMLCSLLYPLRNALLYHDAMDMAQKDPLTGTCNRSALDEMLRRELSHAERHSSQFALIMLDIDHFKNVNDHYGHIIGDCALKVVANTAGRCIRDGDLLFRYGGEEFVVLMRETDLEGARLLAERIRRNIEKTPCHCSGIDIKMTISAGVSTYESGDSPLTLFARADEAMYDAKQNGRNQTCVLTRDDHQQR